MAAEILVTGAPGNVGSEVVRKLHENGLPFRVGARNVEEAKRAFGDDTDVVHFDFLDADTYKETFAGIKRMFLVRPPQLANVQEEIAPAIHAAIRADVEHIVFLSLQGVEKNRFVPHHKIEQLILQSEVTYTFLRASFFMQNLSTTHRDEIRDANEIAVPVGKAGTSFIDTRDIAAVAVCALTEDKHTNKAYTLTGSEALDYYQVADILSAVLQRPIRYTNPFVLRFFWRQLTSGRGWGYALVLTGLYTITRFGNASQVTNDVEQVLGRKPIQFRQFAQDYRDHWIPQPGAP